MTFKILHTADWQIGMKARHAGAAAGRVRAARTLAARRVIAIANEERVDLVLLAGDTFEDTDVPRAAVQEVVDILRASAAPVLVLPGNHDPLVPGGIYDHPAWRDAAPQVRVLRDGAPVAVGAADVLGCPVRSRWSTEDPTQAFRVALGPRQRFLIGVAHGSVIGGAAPSEDLRDDFPIDLDVVRRAGLDWLALGHWHTPSSYALDGVVRAAYCGSHEPTKFGEETQAGERSGQCLLVSLEVPGAPPRIEIRQTAVLTWRQQERRVEGAADLGLLRAEIDAEPPASRETVLLDLRLEGALAAAEAAALGDLQDLARTRFLHARVDAGKVGLKPEDDRWIEALPPGAPVLAGRRLLAEALAGADGAPIARRALELLYRCATEGGS